MIKQVILFRKDLKMRTGKIAAQCAHASLKVFLDLKILPLQGALEIPLSAEMQEWIEGIFAKIVLSVDSEEDLLRAYKLAQEAGLPCALIQDHGKTEFHGVWTYTTVAIGPASSEKIDPITGPSGAVKTSLA